jgi:hypothetical protein
MQVKRISELASDEAEGISYLIESCNFSTPFHTIEWLSIADTVLEDNIYYAFHLDEDRKVRFALPFIVVKDYLWWDMHSFSMTHELVYGGPVFDRVIDLEKLSIINMTDEKLGIIKSLVLTLPPRFDFDRLVKKNLMHIYNTPIIDLSPDIGSIWDSFEYRNVKCNINKAYKNRVEVHIDVVDHVEQFHLYHESTLAAYGRMIPPLEYYERVVGLPFVHMFSAVQSNRPIAVGIIAAYKDTVYYWNNASSPDSRNLRPNDLLVWEIIKWAKENGYRYFDFLIVPIADLPGLGRFKLKFGGKVYPIFQYRLKSTYHTVNKILYLLSHPTAVARRLAHAFAR